MSPADQVDGERLRADLDALGRIGRKQEGGMHRPAYSPADLEARAWLTGRLQAAGISSWRDAAGNIWGRLQGRGEGGAVVVGSHLDTVPGGGPLDGALGVIAGLECLRRVQELQRAHARPIELVAFADEEGRFGPMIGSRAVVGDLDLAALAGATDVDGQLLGAALDEAGLALQGLSSAQRHDEEVAYYLELHIEQGPVLEGAARRLGLVEAICGLFKWRLCFTGQAAHAGTTPMALRKDAFAGLADFGARLPELLREAGSETSVCTVGQAQLFPGAANVVAQEARFTLDVRDRDAEALEQLKQRLARGAEQVAAAHGLGLAIETLAEIAPVSCDVRLVSMLEHEARAMGEAPLRMVSGAGHDAQSMARIAPVGMIFVPSTGGRSHRPDEHTPPEAIEQGANLLLRSILELSEKR